MAQRNTTTDRRCPTCEGAGEVTVSHHTGNPELETPDLCPHPLCIGGWIRFAPRDPLETLARLRAFERRMPGTLARVHGRTCTYSQVRAEAMRPVTLPIDDAHLMVTTETATFFNALVRERVAA